jgi:hypothetical protein
VYDGGVVGGVYDGFEGVVVVEVVETPSPIHHFEISGFSPAHL